MGFEERADGIRLRREYVKARERATEIQCKKPIYGARGRADSLICSFFLEAKAECESEGATVYLLFNGGWTRYHEEFLVILDERSTAQIAESLPRK